MGGGATPGVRVEVNPTQLNKLGIGLEQVRTALGAANANRPKGQLSAIARHSWTIYDNDQIFDADEYRPLIVGQYRNGATVRLGDVADVSKIPSRTSASIGLANGKPAVLMIMFRQPGANIIDTVDRVRRSAARYCKLRSLRPSNSDVVMDRTTTIRASVRDIEYTL